MVKLRKWGWVIVLFLTILDIKAENNKESILSIKNQIPYADDITAPFESNLDSNLVNWYLNDWIELDTNNYVSTEIPAVPDSIMVQRLKQLSEQSVIEFPFNDKVKSFIELYTIKRRSLTESILGLSRYYFPLFEEELDKQNMPLELKYLPVIESALNPRAFSKAGASGLWQFIYSTGRFYKLDISTYIDERRDPSRSTETAVKYLKDLYGIYGDWFLVIAAYNCGPGNVNKAIKRSGGKKDYWEIYYRLPRETRGYVPAYIAAAYTMNFYESHNLMAKTPSIPVMTDTIMITQPLHLKQVSEVLNLSYEVLRDLNPQYRADYIPAGSKTYPLVLPVDQIFTFIDQKDDIFGHKKDVYLAEKRSYASPSNSTYTPSSPANKAKLLYTVKSGDNLGFISEWYHVSLSDLRYWNNIYRNTIRVGQKLVIYVDKNKADYYQTINHMTFSQKQASVGKKPTETNVSASSVSSSPSTKTTSTASKFEDYVCHKVRSGDNLYSIAKRYPGVSAQNIIDLNGMQDTNIKPGMTLKIRPKSI